MNKQESQELSKQIYQLLFPKNLLSINEIIENIYNSHYQKDDLSKIDLRKKVESKMWYAFYRRRLFKEKRDYYSNSKEVAFSIRWNSKTREYLKNSFNIIKA